MTWFTNRLTKKPFKTQADLGNALTCDACGLAKSLSPFDGQKVCANCLELSKKIENNSSSPSLPTPTTERPTHKGACSNCGKQVYVDKNSLCYKCRGGTAK